MLLAVAAGAERKCLVYTIRVAATVLAQDGSASAVFDFAHARDGSARQLVLSGDVLIAIRQLAPKHHLRGETLQAETGDPEGQRKMHPHGRHYQQQHQQQQIYALYALHTGENLAYCHAV